ncbi:MAG: NINE protein [Phycisphaerales bacterium]|nr:NINE protein [Planctomycetota bacterium]MCH8508849.1 NINE protein [Phycisphaerales bacterium]
MKSTGVAYILCILGFFGFAGFHRFYAGKWITGLLWFFTFGIFWIGTIIDLFLIPGMIERANINKRLGDAGL